MNKLTSYIKDLLELTARYLGYDLYIYRETQPEGPFNFTYLVDGVDRELCGLGHHCIISPLWMPPTS
jgi:hypothetical protein